MLTLNTTPSTNRVNPEEARLLRRKVKETHNPAHCIFDTVHAVVVSASVSLGLDLSQEARALHPEFMAMQAEPVLVIAR